MRSKEKMDTNTFTKGVSDQDWARAAKLANITPQQLKTRYEAAVAQHPLNLRKVTVTRGEAVKSGDAIRKDFDISLFDIVGLKGYVEFQGSSSSDWTAAFHICLELAGVSVWCTDETLSPTNAQICYHPDAGGAKADLCLAIQGTNHCFNVSGDACYWAFGWHCGDFNETLFCFG